MRRRDFVKAIAGSVLWPAAARAQQAGRVAKVGILTSGNQITSPGIESFLREMRKLGYIEGRDLTIEFRTSALDPASLPVLAAELLQTSVDVIVTDSTISSVAAKKATSTIPIVAVLGVDPVATGLIASYARPGGNLTGFTLLASELSTKRIEILKETVPNIQRLGVLWSSPSVANAAVQMGGIREAARGLDLEIITGTVEHRDELANAFDRFKAERVSAVMSLADALLFSEHKLVVALALAAKLPGMFPERPYATAGGLLSYGPDVPGVFSRAADYVDRILKGEKPADLPVQQPTKFEFVINLKTAKAMGLSVSESLLLRADEVIE